MSHADLARELCALIARDEPPPSDLAERRRDYEAWLRASGWRR